MKNIGQYAVKEEIGQGGMSKVYLAYDPDSGKDVAIKLMRDGLTDSDKPQARFAKEAQLAISLEHPAIVPVLDYGTIDDRFYIVMQHMPGGSLRDRLDAGPLSLEEGIAILERIASALDGGGSFARCRWVRPYGDADWHTRVCGPGAGDGRRVDATNGYLPVGRDGLPDDDRTTAI
jgi:serine/threonine protein kinase